MRIVVLGNEGSWYVADLMRAAHDCGHSSVRGDFRSLQATIPAANSRNLHREPAAPNSIHAGEISLHNADAILVRTMPPGSLEQVVYRMDALQRLEAQGVRILNSPKAIECAVDKFLTTARLSAAGLPVPATVVCENSEQALAAFTELGGDVVVKPLFGAEGRGILRVSDPDLAHRVFRTLERTSAVLYLQRFIDHPGFDVRLLVLNGTVLGAITRHHPTDFRTNLARQGIAQVHRWNEAEEHLAIAAADATGTCFAGIDLLYDREGQAYVIEVNGVPGWQGFRKVTGIDVAFAVIRSLG